MTFYYLRFNRRSSVFIGGQIIFLFVAVMKLFFDQRSSAFISG
jgi:hypothetical protein